MTLTAMLGWVCARIQEIWNGLTYTGVEERQSVPGAAYVRRTSLRTALFAPLGLGVVLPMLGLLLAAPPPGDAAEFEIVDKLTVDKATLLKGSATWTSIAAPAVSATGEGVMYFDSTDNQFKVSEHGGAYFPLRNFWRQTGSNLYPGSLTSNLGLGTASPATRLHVSGGDVQIGDATASTISASGYMTMALLGSAPAAAVGRLYFDSTSGKLRLSFNGSSFVDIATGTVSAAATNMVTTDTDQTITGVKTFTSSVTVNAAGGIRTTGPIKAGSGNVEIVDSTGKIPALSSVYIANLSGANLTGLNASNMTTGTLGSGVTLDLTNLAYSGTMSGSNISGGTFGSVNGNNITNLNASNLASGAVPVGALGNAIINQSTLQSGATFFVTSGTVSGQFTAGTLLGNGAGLTALNASALATGTVGNARLDSSSVTLQGNSFNSAGKLVQLDGTNRLPAVDASLLTGISASGIQSGTLSSAVLPSSVAYKSVDNSFTATQTFGSSVTVNSDAKVTGILTLGSGAGTAVSNASGNLLSSSLTGALPALNGSALTSLNASALTSGTVGTGVLPSTVAYRNIDNSFSASQTLLSGSSLTVNGDLLATGVIKAGTTPTAITNAAGNVLATALTGTVPSGSLGNAVLKAGDTMTGDLQVGALTASTISASGFVTLASLGSAPSAAAGRLYFDSTSGKLRLSQNGSTFVDIATGSVSGTATNMVTTDTDQTITGVKTFTSSVTVNAAGGIKTTGPITAGSGNVQIVDSTGKIPALTSTYIANLSGANLTSLNASNMTSGTLGSGVTLDLTNLGYSGTLSGSNVSGGTFGAVDGNALTNLNAGNLAGTLNLSGLSYSGTLSGSYISGGTFGAVNGSALTSLNASSIASGTLGDARLSSNVPLLNSTQTFSGANTHTSTVTIRGIDASGYSLFLSSGLNAPNGTLLAAHFSGAGDQLTNLQAANLTGTVPAASLSNAILNQSALQASAVFHVSSGTVAGQTLLATTSGNVGIGTGTPSKKLDVASTGGSSFQVDTANAGYVSLMIGGQEVARIKP